MPELLSPAEDGQSGLDFTVVLAEPLGDEMVVHGTVGGELAPIDQSAPAMNCFRPYLVRAR